MVSGNILYIPLLSIALLDFGYDENTINIDQQIYFLIEDSLEIFEKYTVNNQSIIKRLGQFDGNIFKLANGIESNFLRRRANFQGTELIGMTEIAGNDFKVWGKAHISSKSQFCSPQSQLKDFCLALQGYCL